MQLLNFITFFVLFLLNSDKIVLNLPFDSIHKFIFTEMKNTESLPTHPWVESFRRIGLQILWGCYHYGPRAPGCISSKKWHHPYSAGLSRVWSPLPRVQKSVRQGNGHRIETPALRFCACYVWNGEVKSELQRRTQNVKDGSNIRHPLRKVAVMM